MKIGGSIYRSFMLIGLFLFAGKGAGSDIAAAGYDYQFEDPQVRIGQFESELAGKFTRGVINTGYGWTEIFRTPAEWTNRIDRGPWLAWTVGLPYGMFRFVGRTLVGVYEIATFYAPQKPIFAPIEGDVL